MKNIKIIIITSIIVISGLTLSVQIVEDLHLKNSWGGFTPLHYVLQEENPAFREKDFDNGISKLDYSLLIKSYLYVPNLLSINEEQYQKFLIFVCIFLLLMSFYYLSETCLNSKIQCAHIYSAAIAVFLTSSNVFHSNLARFGFPAHEGGQMYGFAAVCIIFAVSFLMKGNHIFAWISSLCCILFHTSLGLMISTVSAMVYFSEIFFIKKKYT